MPKRSGRKSASQTPAPPKERIYGSKKNPKGSASSEKSAKQIKLNSDIIASLTKKLKEFKGEHPNNKKITLADLKAVYRRGLGAYSSTHRPTISGGKPNTRNAWAMARVNKFLEKASGKPVKKAYVQDDDLLNMHLGGDMSKHLAPNGKPSNLTHEQWHLVRTPEFKVWFGDWENGIFTDYQKFVEYKHKTGTGRANLLDLEYIVNDSDLGKAKKIKEIHKEANEFIELSYEKAIKNNYQIDFEKFINEYLSIYKYAFELVDTLQLNSDLILAKTSLEIFSKSAFDKWVEYKNRDISKVVDENGEPLVVYRGESDKFNVFNPKKLGTTLKTSWRYAGFYFATNKMGAEQYAYSRGSDIVKSFFLNLRNPYIIDSNEFFDVMDWGSLPNQRFKNLKSSTDYAKNRIEEIKSNNYDGVYVKILDKNKVIEIIAFNPTQIKLADGTNTTFDGSNPDIRYEGGGEIDKLIQDGIVEIKMYDTKPEHAKMYGFDSERPLYIHSIIVSKEHRGKGIGSKVMQHIVDYATTNGHDVIFGHITQKSKPSIDVIKSMLRKSGFKTIEGNNDFYKIMNEYADGGSVKSFYKWYLEWYKGIKDEMTIMISLPNQLRPMPEKNVVIIDKFKKDKQSVKAYKYLQEIIDKADEYGITIYLEPTPLSDTNTKFDLVKYYKKFGFELTPNKEYMKRVPNYAIVGETKNPIKRWADSKRQIIGNVFGIEGKPIYTDGGITDKYEISDYWDIETFGGGGEVKTKKIITDKIGWNESVADFFIEADPKLAIWLADGYMKYHLKINYLPHNNASQEFYDLYKIKISDRPTQEDWDKLPLEIKKEFINGNYPKYNDFYLNGGVGTIDEHNFRADREIRSILDWLKHPMTPKQDLKKLSISEALEKAKQWHDELTTLGGDVDFVEPEENTILIKYPKNENEVEYYWVKIPKQFCSLESKRMGHCGRTGSGDSLISLRSVRPYGKGHTINDSHVTIAYNEKKGIFYQTKGKNNAKPSEKYFPYIFDLIKMLAKEDRYLMIPEIESQQDKLITEIGSIEDVIKVVKEDIYDIRIRVAKLDEMLIKSRSNREFDEIKNAMEDLMKEERELMNRVESLQNDLKNTNQKFQKNEDTKVEIKEGFRYGFSGFGSEYTSSADYGWDDMTKEQIEELYEVRPNLFRGLGGELILFNKGIIDEKPNTKFIIEKDAKNIDDLVDYDGFTKFLKSIVVGDMYEVLDLYVDKDEVIKYYLDDLNEKNMNYVLEEISKITSIPIEEVKENGAEYYLSGEFFEEGEDDFYFDSITDAIRRAVTLSMESDAYNYYYGELKSTLSELGEVLNLNDEGIKIEVDLSNLLTLNEISALSKEVGDNLNDIFFEAEYQNQIDLPKLRFDDRFSPSADAKQINEYFEPDFYEKGGITDGDKKEIYKKWKSLVNMSKGELERFYNSQEGKDAGLSPSEAKSQGIDSGRESARWIMKMKDTPYSQWTPQMWKWANKQISFISRMSGNKGSLYDDKGRKTRKHTSLLIWGHNPEKKSGGGDIKSNATYEDVVELLKKYQFRKRKTFGDEDKYDSWRNSTKINGEEVDCFIDKQDKIIVLDSQYGQKEVGYDLSILESYFKKNRLKKDKYEGGGEIPDNIINILKEKRAISDRVDEASRILNEIANSDERPMGLVSERVRNSKEYIDAKREYESAFSTLRNFNSSEKGKTLEKYLKKKGMAERIKINKMRFNDGGTINQSINTNIMDNVKFNELPHIDTISDGDQILIHENVFGGNLDNPMHIGERYILCTCMGKGGMVDALNLEVVKSVGTNPLLVGQKITRPILNVLQKGRKYIVEPITDTISFKKGGLNPDNSQVKQYFAHGSGNAGGVLVGKRHSEGGIKAINKSTGTPIEMEGGEVVITRGAVSNPKKYAFDGKDMTTKEILSKLNVDGGGVSFAEGGDVPDKMKCGCKELDLGGVMMSPQDFISQSEKDYQQYRLSKGIEKERKDHYEILSKLNAGTITIDRALREIAMKEMEIDPKYPFGE
jgi:GNAT superfamily N-acetyltransferase